MHLMKLVNWKDLNLIFSLSRENKLIDKIFVIEMAVQTELVKVESFQK